MQDIYTFFSTPSFQKNLMRCLLRRFFWNDGVKGDCLILSPREPPFYYLVQVITKAVVRRNA
jgi:hypothetical protein